MTLAVLFCVVIAVFVLVANLRGRSKTKDELTDTSGPQVSPPAEELTPFQEAVPKQDAQSPKPGQPFRGWKWKTIAFMDVETTGLTGHDRVVTLAVILLEVPTVNEGETQVEITISAIHRIYNPGRDCDVVASRMHGHSDWELRHQPFFIEEAREVSEYIGRADLVVCHNAEFDLRFINREFAKASMPPIAGQSFCTMEGYRLKYAGSASLDNVIRQLGLKRETGKHGALEDAWLTMNVFFVLHDTKAGWPFSTLGEEKRMLQNLREVPPMPLGELPPRKRRPRARTLQPTPPGDA
jgi:DNA polymerase III epsilon subunit-like protein